MINLGMLKTEISFKLNGEQKLIKNLPTTATVLDYLRNTENKATKKGCGDGDCGACTISILVSEDGKTKYKAVNSCLLPIAAIDGKEIFTAEGIESKNGLHPVQESLLEHSASQCGYCTPGITMSMFSAFYSGKLDDSSLEGNLCRCTGYVPIRVAAQALDKPAKSDRFAKKLKKEVKSKAFDLELNKHLYYLPATVEQAVEYLKDKDAIIIAGATDLGLELSHKSKDYPVLVSVENIAELKEIKNDKDSLTIGAGINLSYLEENLKTEFKPLEKMLKVFAARQIRNRATIGGNIGTASPIGDLLPVFLALDAKVNLAGPKGRRSIDIADYFVGYRQTKKEKDELIVSVTLNKQSNKNKYLSSSYKVSKRASDDISIVSAAYFVELDNNKIVTARLAYGGVAATPVRAKKAEKYLIGKTWNKETIEETKAILLKEFKPLDDVRASAKYRNKLVANLFEKFFVEES